MQEAIPYRRWETRIATPSVDRNSNRDEKNAAERVRSLVSENAVLVVGRRGCCMCHVVTRLLLSLGVNPVVYELEEEDEEVGVVVEEISGGGDPRLQFPAVFIGGRLVGGLDQLMALHIAGDLVPILKKAGALWL
ncbi:glutaredoxin-C9-like [Tasmannia lanceolata]|uniref:glutaredoxin-C9-like n=1 Tax=Tasmannia lanceolata TaxID=3420 RepID=UPI0040642DD8